MRKKKKLTKKERKKQENRIGAGILIQLEKGGHPMTVTSGRRGAEEGNSEY